MTVGWQGLSGGALSPASPAPPVNAGSSARLAWGWVAPSGQADDVNGGAGEVRVDGVSAEDPGMRDGALAVDPGLRDRALIEDPGLRDRVLLGGGGGVAVRAREMRPSVSS